MDVEPSLAEGSGSSRNETEATKNGGQAACQLENCLESQPSDLREMLLFTINRHHFEYFIFHFLMIDVVQVLCS